MAATRNFRRSRPPCDGEVVRRTTYVQFLPSKKRLKNISSRHPVGNCPLSTQSLYLLKTVRLSNESWALSIKDLIIDISDSANKKCSL
jgi:hypothetical protein